MTIYCTGKSKAIVTILSPKQIIQVNAPADIQIVEPSVETYVHDMRSPIDKTFNSTVNSVTFTTSGQTYSNGAPVNPIRDCPIPVIDKNRITANFDDYYADNSGSCSYQISLGKGISVNGKVFPTNDGQYTVACDEGCPEGYLRCECNEYPGYCCIPCSEIRNGIAAITATVRGLNNG